MASEVVCGLIFRLLLPVCLVAACLFRYNGLSFMYLIFLLLIPLFSEPTRKTMQGHTGRLLKTLCFTSLTFLLLHTLFQITIYSLQAHEKIMPGFNCTDWEKTFRQIGFESVSGADAGNIIRLFAPDVGMFVAGVATWLVCKNLVQQPPTEAQAQYNPEFQNEEQDEEKLELADAFIYEEDFEVADVVEEMEEEANKPNILRRIATYASKLKEFIGNIIATTGKVVVTILLGLTGIMLPSLTSGVYFFVFLGLCTWWSCGKQFDPLIFSCLCVLMAIFSAGHLIGLYLYQLQFLQELIPPGDFYARLFGVSPVIQTNCTTTWKIIANPNMSWSQHVNPIMLLLLYYTLATLIRLWLQEPVIRDIEAEENYEREEEVHREPSGSDSHVNANMRGNMCYSAHCATDERWLLTITQDDTNSSDAFLVTVNGNPVDYHNMNSTLQAENGPATLEMYSTPQYKWEMADESPDKTEEDKIPEEAVNSRLNSLITIFRFIMKQSYICALIAMMAWSITYHSWLTFVLLIWSCVLWMVRDRRRYAMLTSPFMVFYGNVLLTLQYIWSLDLTEAELPELSGVLKKMRKNPCVELSSKILCALTFWLLLRQYITERREAKKLQESALSEVKVEELEDGQQGKQIMKVLGTLVMGMFVKYWIYICGGMFFFVSFEGKIVMYKIIYMMLFLFCVALYQVHYDWWRRILKYFWIIVVSYTMLVLVLVYTYQFDSFPNLWRNMTGMDIEKLKDLGLEQFSVTDLFTSIFIPTSFLLVCVLHLHYFHDRFLELTDLKAVTSKQESTIYRLVNQEGSLPDIGMMNLNTSAQKEERMEDKKPEQGDEDDEEGAEEPSEKTNKWHLVIDRLTVLFLKFMETFHKLQVMAWWILELHIIKIVSFYIIWITLKEVSLLNYVFLISWAFALPYVKLRPLASSACTVMTCIIIVCKMLYQLSSVEPSNYSSNCTLLLNETNVEENAKLKKSVLYANPVDPANWIGLRKSSPLLVYLKNNLLILAVLAFEVTIYRHQEYFRLHNNLAPPITKTIFHDITRQHLDNGLVNCAKYFINYFFYKFGLEICFLMTVNVIGQRMDLYAMLHAFWLFALLYRRRRKAIAELWPKYCCFLACILTFQYLLCIGIPPAACKEYPWRYVNAKINSNFIKWLYFPDFITNPNPMFLIYDFLMLLCASLQWQVFEDENRAAVRIVAGDNVEICRDLDAATFSQHNPVPDFIHCRSYLDMIKVIGFSYLFWFVLTIIFITGTTRISIFCMGYLVACFYFLLFGGELLLKPIKIILQYWDCLIAYNVFVITMKNILSIGACAYINSLILKSCWLIQTFGLVCTVKGYDEPPPENVKKCPLPKDEAGIIWDSICFSFLLLQRRVFMSYYFLHVVADIKSAQILASRGAELFQAIIVKAVKARLEEEKKSMDQLKRQMDRIKTRQQKYKKGKERMLSLTQSVDVQGPQVKQEDDDDDDDEGEPEKDKAKGKKKQWWRPWVDHASMVRSGDYYLFETDSEEENEEELKEEEEEEEPKKSGFQRAVRKFVSAIIALPKSILKLPKTILQLIVRAVKFIYQTWMKDSKSVLKEREKNKRKGWERGKKEAGGHIAIECEETEELPTPEEVRKNSKAPDNVIKRVFNLLKFTWVLFLALVDSFTKWLNSISKECIDISTVLRIERCMLTREVKKGNVPCRDSIQNYYKHQMKIHSSRESNLDRNDDGARCVALTIHEGNREVGAERMDSMDSIASRDSLSSCYTEATMLYSRQSTLDDIDDIPKTSERARPRLRKMYSVDMSSSSVESCSIVSSEPTQCTMLYSRQGTTDTIEEVEDEQDEEATIPVCTADTMTEEVPPSYSKAVSLDRLSFSSDSAGEKHLMALTPDSRMDVLEDIFPNLSHELTASELLLNKMFYDEELEESEKFYKAQPRALLLFFALYNTLVARSEMLCFFVIILNHMVSASMITLVIPILIFLWAMLSVPRPSKRFWMTAIVYTEVTIVIKYFFQFGFFPWNENLSLHREKPDFPPNIIGIEKKEGYVHYDLIQLLALFFHRSILKCHGLWDDDDKNENTSAKNDMEEDHLNESQRKNSLDSLKSINLQASMDSIHVHFPEQTTARRLSSTGSQISNRSSHRSQRGSISTRNSSSRKGSGSLSVQAKDKKELLLEKLREQMIKAKAIVIAKTLQIYIPIRHFFYNIIHPEYSAVTDVYVLMFLADVVDFIVIIFGFGAFGKHSAAADITSSLSEDQVPEAFLVMLIIQFGTMVVDRALYLRKTVLGKVVFQVILVFGIHFWMFFILPKVTERRFSQNKVAQIWYFVKCVYFGLSAYQIRCGYPTRVLGNFLTKSYNYINLFLFQGFRLVPFLTELRAVMDWVWTDTTLSLSSWICIEDIYAHIFILKCWRESEKRYPQPRGQKKKKVVKYGMGGLIVFLLICIVWFPLLFMSLIKSVAGVTNKPLDVSVTITIGGYQPIFTMSAQQKQLQDFNPRQRKRLLDNYIDIPAAMQFLDAYMTEDILIAQLEGNSNSLWTISPPSREKMIEELSNETSKISIVVCWSVQRNASLGGKSEIASDKISFEIKEQTGKGLAELIKGNENKPVKLEKLFPNYIRAPSGSETKPVRQLYKNDADYSDLIVRLVQKKDNITGHIQEWWTVNQTERFNGNDNEENRKESLEIIVFSDKVSPPSLGFLAGYGIVGLYASVVLVIGKFVREFFSGISHDIMFEELPNVDRILKLCTDIFLVRETGELELEEDLYAKLIFLYRSPETMIKWTREKTK
ncbi:piezo-type mechanosensitive ion channel component 2-like isoform X2 [Scyliorhinus torazame]|uniref:piezo-type mechanosensitive ion channel component 2-like isoform X2 n=1 Tax=Scyliorhinus torazame TaxID=75743 RepID=UPI003B5B3E63